MNKNYEAWNLDLADYYSFTTEEQKMHFILRFAVLAPSSHNSQPWMFRVRNNSIEILVNHERALPGSDKNNRQLYISLGCVVENIAVAARYYAIALDIDVVAGKDVAARIIFDFENKGEARSDLAKCIPKRITVRGEYIKKVPDNQYVQAIKKCAENNDIKVSLVDSDEKKIQIAKVVINSTAEAMSDDIFRAELSDFLLTPSSGSGTGMPATAFGMPVPLAYVAPFMLRHFNMNKTTQKKDTVLLEDYTPMFVVLHTQEDSPRSWIGVGRTFQHMALLAVENNIQVAPMAAPIQIGEHFKALQSILQINTRPQFFFRLGYTDETNEHSPRLSANSCINQ